MKTIAIVAGGDSSEFEVSVKSATEVSNVLASKYFTYIIMIKGANWYWEDPKGRYISVDKNDFTLKTDDIRIRFSKDNASQVDLEVGDCGGKCA